MASWRRAVAALLIVLVLIAAAPGLVYGLGLWMIDGRPQPRAATPVAAAAAWVNCREPLPLRVQPLNPWGVMLDLLRHGSRSTPGARAAWVIARDHNARHLGRRGVWWHVSGSAMVIWITRHWSAEQIAATAAAEGLCRPARRT